MSATLLEKVEGRQRALMDSCRPLLDAMIELDVHTVKITIDGNSVKLEMDARENGKKEAK